MTEKEFCIWFQGFLDITKTFRIEPSELLIIKKELELTLSANKQCCVKKISPPILLKDAMCSSVNDIQYNSTLDLTRNSK